MVLQILFVDGVGVGGLHMYVRIKSDKGRWRNSSYPPTWRYTGDPQITPVRFHSPQRALHWS